MNTYLPSDPTNNPSLVILNGITLPGDVIITPVFGKVIPETVILDGAVVFEHIRQKPQEINFDFTFREINTGQYPNAPLNSYVFPQQMIENFLENTWELDQVLEVENTYLNGMGINNVILLDLTQTTIRGNTNVLCSIKTKALYGSIIQPQSLIIIPPGD